MHKMLLDLPPSIESERLVLRPYRAGDGAAYYDVCLRNCDHLLPYEAGNPALEVDSLEAAEILVREFAAYWIKRDVFFLGGWTKAEGAFAMQLYIGAVDWGLPEFEVGDLADVDHEGQGYVSEALRAALPFLFDCLGAHRLRLNCNELNERSWRVAERCGFVREGWRRETHKALLRADGRPSGDYLYGMLRADFERLRR